MHLCKIVRDTSCSLNTGMPTVLLRNCLLQYDSMHTRIACIVLEFLRPELSSVLESVRSSIRNVLAGVPVSWYSTPSLAMLCISMHTGASLFKPPGPS